jgi:hypothetical protein
MEFLSFRISRLKIENLQGPLHALRVIALGKCVLSQEERCIYSHTVILFAATLL